MKKNKVNDDRLEYSCQLTRGIAHPIRLKILKVINDHGVISVNKIYNTLNLNQSTASQHLRILRLAGYVSNERNGNFMHYHINFSHLQKVSFAINNFTE